MLQVSAFKRSPFATAGRKAGLNPALKTTRSRSPSLSLQAVLAGKRKPSRKKAAPSRPLGERVARQAEKAKKAKTKGKVRTSYDADRPKKRRAPPTR